MLLSCYHGEESELCGILWGLIECREDEKYTKDDQEASSLSALSVPVGTRSDLLSPSLDLLYLEQAGGVGGSYLCPQIPVLNRKLIFLPKTWNLGMVLGWPIGLKVFHQISASISLWTHLSTEDSEGSLMNDRLIKCRGSGSQRIVTVGVPTDFSTLTAFVLPTCRLLLHPCCN